MLRILHPTYQWGESAKKEAEQEEEEKPGSDIALCCVLLQKTKNWKKKKQEIEKKDRSVEHLCKNTLLYILLYSRAVSTAVRWKDADQIEVQPKSRPFLLRAHTHSERLFLFLFFFFLGAFLTPQLTRREKRKTPRTPDSFIEALKSQSCDWKNASEWKRAC